MPKRKLRVDDSPGEQFRVLRQLPGLSADLGRDILFPFCERMTKERAYVNEKRKKHQKQPKSKCVYGTRRIPKWKLPLISCLC